MRIAGWPAGPLGHRGTNEAEGMQGETMTAPTVEQQAAPGGGKQPAGPAGESFDEGQLADLPWPPTRTFRSGGAIISLTADQTGHCDRDAQWDEHSCPVFHD